MSFWTEKYKPISDAMRTVLGTDELIAPEKYAEKVPEIYEKGRSDEWNEFWDGYQQNGKRGNYQFSFAGIGWTNEKFTPKYDIIVTNSAYGLFWGTGLTGDLVEILDSLNVTLDISKATQYHYTFNGAGFTRLGVINLSGSVALQSTFSQCTKLETIDKLIFRADGTNTFNTTFANCSDLKNIVIEGVIGTNIVFNHSPLLTIESLKSIITHLKNYKGTSFDLKNSITLSAASKTLLDQEGATSPNNTTWSSYITDHLGWNLL